MTEQVILAVIVARASDCDQIMAVNSTRYIIFDK